MADVNIISDTVQEFMGEKFYLCGSYFQHKGKRLHRAVWEHYNGKIPEGYHVHHVDANRSNNDISNLALMSAEEHEAMHANEEERRENGRRAIKLAIAAAPEWHGSADGFEWHSKHAKEYWENAPYNTYVCDACGKEYTSKVVRHSGRHFCSDKCKARHLRARRKGLA
jgi:hypothetical protein